jgi:predicted nucleotidyltransferase component of viral defense system
MKPLRGRLEEARRRTGGPWEVLERDYVLSWVLAGIGRVPRLADTLVFKGGTALKKCYFGDYRFSEDLDFSTVGQPPVGDDMENAVAEACSEAEKLLDEYAPVRFVCSRYTERDPHPGGQEAFTIKAQLPWHRDPQTKVMVEVTTDEQVLRRTPARRVIHEYGELLDATIPVYALEEVMAEKLRAILQHVEELKVRGWSRSRSRDYYDLWRVLGTYEADLDLTGFSDFLRKKCDVRGVRFDGPDDFFQETMLAYVERTWEDWLAPLVTELPALSTVIGELRPRVEEIITGS